MFPSGGGTATEPQGPAPAASLGELLPVPSVHGLPAIPRADEVAGENPPGAQAGLISNSQPQAANGPAALPCDPSPAPFGLLCYVPIRAFHAFPLLLSPISMPALLMTMPHASLRKQKPADGDSLFLPKPNTHTFPPLLLQQTSLPPLTLE